MSPVRRITSVVAALVVVASLAPAEELPPLVTGEIHGALFTIAQPAHWNRNVMIYAHGYRPESAAFSSKLDPTESAWAKLVADGWIVAATSYRRNGIVVRDAISDIDALRDHVERTNGAPALVLLFGESMGGAIVTLMAERSPDRYQGAIAIGAALDLRDNTDPLVPSTAPRAPILFLTNQSELEGPAAYVEAASHAPVPPVLWTISRDGHVNVNQAERARAIEGLIGWVTTGQIERRLDATRNSTNVASEAEFVGHTARGRVREVTDNFGNIFTNFTPEDFARLGIVRGSSFLAETNGKTWRVRFGKDFSDVARGEWVAFLRAEGVIIFAMNYGNAANTAGLHSGDAITIRPEANP